MGVVDIQRIAFIGHESSRSGLAVEVVALLTAVCSQDLHTCAVRAQINYHGLASSIQIAQVSFTVVCRCDVVAADKVSCLAGLGSLSRESGGVKVKTVRPTKSAPAIFFIIVIVLSFLFEFCFLSFASAVRQFILFCYDRIKKRPWSHKSHT